MRKDMFKVIVERPRLVNSNGYSGDGRGFRNQEDGPMRLGMKEGYGHTKWLNENLAPLERFLEKQVGRPWDKVYSEIRAVIDARSTVKHHILQHLDDFVTINTVWVGDDKGGHVVVKGGRHSWNNNWMTLQESYRELYVHPRTGILCRNKFYRSWQNRRKDERQQERQQAAEQRRVISPLVQLHCIGGTWYEVHLAQLPAPRVVSGDKPGTTETIHDYQWDVVERRHVIVNQGIAKGRNSIQARNAKYGDPWLYAKSKRQLSRQELKKHGLENKAPSGLVYLWRKLRARLRQGWTIFPMFGIR